MSNTYKPQAATTEKRLVSCDNCGTHVSSYDTEKVDNETLCLTCYDEMHTFICDHCEDSHHNNDKADGFQIGIDDSEQFGVPQGFYKIIKKPFFISDMLSIVSLETKNIKLLKPFDSDNSNANFCKDCFQKLTQTEQ